MQYKSSVLQKNQIVILGSGTSTGVPLLFCNCTTCRSKNLKNKRLRASIWVVRNGKSFLIDTATDLRQQALAHKIPKIDAVLYTHPHSDHIGGFDELRSFNFIQRSKIPLFGNRWTCTELKTRYRYAFSSQKQEGGGIPLVELNPFWTKDQKINVCGQSFEVISVKHGSKECVAYRWDDIAYVTDCSYISSKSMARLRNLNVLILDCLKFKPHPTHLNYDQALDLIKKLRPSKAVLTHMGHDIEYSRWSKKLPKGVSLAFDGMKISF